MKNVRYYLIRALMPRRDRVEVEAALEFWRDTLREGMYDTRKHGDLEASQDFSVQLARATRIQKGLR